MPRTDHGCYVRLAWSIAFLSLHRTSWNKQRPRSADSLDGFFFLLLVATGRLPCVISNVFFVLFFALCCCTSIHLLNASSTPSVVPSPGRQPLPLADSSLKCPNSNTCFSSTAAVFVVGVRRSSLYPSWVLSVRAGFALVTSSFNHCRSCTSYTSSSACRRLPSSLHTITCTLLWALLPAVV